MRPSAPSVAPASGPLLAPTVPLYEAYSSVLQRLNELGTLQQRVGNRSWSPNAAVQAERDAGKPIIGRGAWARMEGSNTHIDPSTSTTSANYNVRMWKFEGGVDAPVVENPAGTLVVGPNFHYGIANSNVSSMFGNGFGGTATWYGNNQWQPRRRRARARRQLVAHAAGPARLVAGAFRRVH
ncbi:autotransporter outer membrane beta-barrel domain-containing protein [Cupriavidus pauculus]|uniref:autotransporter outer membrane beta-barrel domain-containing protein n=1 Tax=Cupriavidus pauculus TaxID=82633 RepID=UPI000AF3DEFE|nr:autotransporter outer membrane beta-barrel domain-containing protein [Cupriavidus pauculus]